MAPVRQPSAAPSALRYLELTCEPVGVHDFDGRYTYVNPALAAMAGVGAQDLLGRHWSAVMHPDDRAEAAAVFARLTGGEVNGTLEVRAGTRAEGWRWLLLTVLADHDARLVYAIGKDVSEAREAKERFRSAFEDAAIGMSITSLDGRLQRVNAALCELVGRDPEELVGSSVAELTHPDDRAADHEAMTLMRASRSRSHRTRTRYLRPDGSVVWVALNATLVTDAGEPRYFISQMSDITDRVAASGELARREAELRMLTENTTDFLSRHRPDGGYRYASRASRRLLGWDACDLEGRPALGGVHRDDRAAVAKAFAAAAGGGQTVVQYRAVHRDGRFVWIESTLSGVRAEDEVVEVVAVSRDVSERKLAEVELARQATHDRLTGLPNRALFLDRLSHALARLARRPGVVGVLFLDLDRFKLVNDSLGHAAGDRLLVDVAQRLASALRPADTVARFGGDEFTVICEDITRAAEAGALADRVVELFREPFAVEGAEIFLDPSIGIGVAADGAVAPEALVADADAAMYRAKGSGGRVEHFDAAMRADAQARLATETALRRALQRDELQLCYQPIVHLTTGTVVAFEALVRWQHPSRGLLRPEEFVSLAEETGLIVPIGAWVLDQACGQAVGWPQAPGAAGPPGVSVNLSARQLGRGDLHGVVAGALERSGLDPTRLCLEITESAVLDSSAHITDALADLKALGIALALDDFGSGYTSLAHLRRLPVDIIKIDRSFVAGMGAEPQDAAVLTALVSLSRGLGLGTVAEGIETATQREELTSIGCETGQGFVFAKPQTPEQAVALIGRVL